jgi:4-hydroxy-2-oxoheptanedioate aldolase
VITAAYLDAFSARLRSGTPTFGTFATLGSAAAAEFLAHDGFGFVVVDCQHGLAGQTEMVEAVRAIAAHGALPFVRPPVGDLAAVERALDCGAAGIIVPGVDDAAFAAEVVAHTRYAPQGARSFGPVRAELMLGLDPAAAACVLCMVMIESSAGLANVEQICAVPGIDGVFVGPADLAVSLGMPPTVDIAPGEHADAIERIRSTASAAGLAVGIHTITGAQAAARAAAGFGFVTVGSDAVLMRWATRNSLRAARNG